MSLDFKTKKSLGQHFLTSDIVPKWLCDAGKLTPGETVLEIGPGTGVLTRELLARGVTVLALEADPRAVTVLDENFKDAIASGQLSVAHADVRTFDPSSLGLTAGSYSVVANIPYYLSGLLFRLFLTSSTQPKTLVFLVQKEVAKRATSSLAKGSKESLLSLSVQVYGDATYVRDVSRGHFQPPPKVDSGIIAIYAISRDRLEGVDEALFFDVLHLGFGQKRKQLLGNLAKKYSRAELINIFSTISLPVSTRAEDVSLRKWLELVKHLPIPN